MPLNLGHINTARAALNRASWKKSDLPVLTETPKGFNTPNYVVQWKVVDGAVHKKAAFTSLEDALKHAEAIQRREYIAEIRVLRSGPHPLAPNWIPTKRTTGKLRVSRNSTGEVTVQEDAWLVPEGYVDTEADKHGPPIYVPPSNNKRTNAEKAEWARNNSCKIDRRFQGY